MSDSEKLNKDVVITDYIHIVDLAKKNNIYVDNGILKIFGRYNLYFPFEEKTECIACFETFEELKASVELINKLRLISEERKCPWVLDNKVSSENINKSKKVTLPSDIGLNKHWVE